MPNTKKTVCLVLSLMLLMLLSACQGNPYTISFNDNVLYSPSPNLPDRLLDDANLQGCLNQLYINNENDDPDSISILACPNASISTLNGIAGLPNLEQLELSENNISDLSPLLRLNKLRLLSIRNNQITNISSLLSLPILRFVSLQGNTNISCRQLDALEEKIGNTLNRPLSCN